MKYASAGPFYLAKATSVCRQMSASLPLNVDLQPCYFSIKPGHFQVASSALPFNPTIFLLPPSRSGEELEDLLAMPDKEVPKLPERPDDVNNAQAKNMWDSLARDLYSSFAVPTPARIEGGLNRL